MGFALAIFVFWLLAVVIFQFSAGIRQKLDPFYFYLCGLLPTWRLFTPRPADGDWLLHYRTSPQADASFSNWKEVDYIRQHFAGRVFFNPNGQIVKAMYEICSYASLALTTRNVYYRLLLNEVAGRVGPVREQTDARFIQFQISWRSAGTEEPIFLSNVHEL